MTEPKAIEVGSLVRHKCGGPMMYVYEMPKPGLHAAYCVYWNAVTGRFENVSHPPEEMVGLAHEDARDIWLARV